MCSFRIGLRFLDIDYRFPNINGTSLDCIRILWRFFSQLKNLASILTEVDRYGMLATENLIAPYFPFGCVSDIYNDMIIVFSGSNDHRS